MFTLIRKLVPLLPTSIATRFVCWLAGITQRPRLKERDHQALAQAQRTTFGRHRRHVVWRWGDSGPVILLIHGWGGHAAQMAPLAQHLASMGFICMAPDITGHGQSPGRRTSFAHFIHDISELAHGLRETPHAIIGHSAAGLAMMAARAIQGLHTTNYVSLNAPLYPYVPIDKIRAILKPPPAVLQACQPYFAAPFHSTWQQLQHGHAYRPSAHSNLMMIYDTDDTEVNHHDADAIRAQWPNAQLLKTSGLGHNKVLWDEAVIAAIADFLSPQRQAERPPATVTPRLTG